jgi:hypothetical protein
VEDATTNPTTDTAAPLPPALRQRLDEAREQMGPTSAHAPTPYVRYLICVTLSPGAYLGGLRGTDDLSGYARRTRLGIAAARRVLPLWEHAVAASRLPSPMCASREPRTCWR